MGSLIGHVNLVLHTHLPWVKKAGRWPFGEEWLYEAIFDSYIPLTQAFLHLRDQGYKYNLTINVTPVLGEMLLDEYLQAGFVEYVSQFIEKLEQDETEVSEDLKAFWLDTAQARLRFYESLERDILGIWRELQDQGYLNLITCAATHGFLPLLGRDETIDLQIETGVLFHSGTFGKKPKGLWLPECAYRPRRYHVAGGAVILRPGIEEFLERHGLEYTFLDSKPFENYVSPEPWMTSETKKFSLMQPYRINESNVAAFPRHDLLCSQVWSADFGYPGDGNYMEFHKKSSYSGARFWRITSKNIDFELKEPYDPLVALKTVGGHAKHYASRIVDELSEYYKASHKEGIATLTFDTELFGHWWFEGPKFLEFLVKELAEAPVQWTSGERYLEMFPTDSSITLGETSWGAGGHYGVWFNPEVEWMWPHIYEAENKTYKALRARAASSDERATRQLLRELLLLTASDWQFLITTRGAVEYAKERFLQHLSNVVELADALELGKQVPSEKMDGLEDKDSLFFFLSPELIELG
ncbi:DUF1957 domain-containing protein [Coprothermobacteraceae bacterium]|nr:DUF1957 domain-containing protein [Coprothermobacteraceae bacterium]